MQGKFLAPGSLPTEIMPTKSVVISTSQSSQAYKPLGILSSQNTLQFPNKLIHRQNSMEILTKDLEYNHQRLSMTKLMLSLITPMHKVDQLITFCIVPFGKAYIPSHTL